MPALTIPEFYRPIVDRLAQMPENDVAALRAALSAVKPSLRIASLVAQVRAALPQAIPDLQEIISALSAMNTTRFNAEAPLEQFAQDIAISLERRREKLRDLNASAFAKRLVSLLGVESLVLSAKAVDVQHEHERLFSSARIVSDIRPVFGEPVKPVGAMIIHNLRVRYFQDGQMKAGLCTGSEPSRPD